MSSHRHQDRPDRGSSGRYDRRRSHSSQGVRVSSSYDSRDSYDRSAQEAASRAFGNRSFAEHESASILAMIQAQLTQGFGVTQAMWQKVSDLPSVFRGVLTEELSGHQQHVDQIGQQLSSAHAQLAERKTIIDSLSDENGNSQREVNRLETRIAELTSQVEDKERQCNQQLARINALIEETNGKDRSISESEGRLTRLRARCQDLTALGSKNTETINALTQALNSKKQETRKLHDIILQSGQTETTIADEDVVKNFQRMNYNILRVVKRHYLGSARKLKWKDGFNNLSPETRELWVRAMIADEIHKSFFSPSSKLFGFDEQREKALAELECFVAASEKVSQEDVIEWRVKTVSIARSLDVDHNDFRAKHLASNLVEDLKDFRTVKTSAAQEEAIVAIDKLCRDALLLAVLMRGTKAGYLWEQDAKPQRINSEDLEIIGSLDEKVEPGQGRVARVVFGAVVKTHSSGGENEVETILLRKAEVYTDA